MAFTLSEVLITLVVIGIVAAITVPAIVARQREQATVEKVKKFYSTMSNAVKRAIVDTGLDVDEWGLEDWTRESSVKFMSIIRPYLVLSADDCGNDASGQCYSTVITKNLKGADRISYYSDNRYYKAILNDGSVFWFRTTPSGAYFWYDINGTKSPNQFGKDTFIIALNTNKVYAYSNENNCNLNDTGEGCAGYILKYGNMDYLH